MLLSESKVLLRGLWAFSLNLFAALTALLTVVCLFASIWCICTGHFGFMFLFWFGILIFGYFAEVCSERADSLLQPSAPPTSP